MRILVIAPHADDEVLGCGGLTAKRVRAGHTIRQVIVSIGDVTQGTRGIKATSGTRRAELSAAAQVLGAEEPIILFEGYENKLDTLSHLDLVSRLDAILSDDQFDQVFLPYPSHHQDHRIVYQACLSALRPKGQLGPSLIALYEYPYVAWSPVPIERARYYVDITEYIALKQAALQAYSSQIYPAPHPVSWESVELLAQMRGNECAVRLAELFYIVRMTDSRTE